MIINGILCIIRMCVYEHHLTHTIRVKKSAPQQKKYSKIGLLKHMFPFLLSQARVLVSRTCDATFPATSARAALTFIGSTL